MNLLCCLFGHRFLKSKGGRVYRVPDASVCFRCGPLNRRAR